MKSLAILGVAQNDENTKTTKLLALPNFSGSKLSCPNSFEMFLSSGILVLMKYSLILPMYNEEETIPHLFQRLKPVLEGLGSFEVICVDDGSKDGTFLALKYEKKDLPELKIVRLKKNSGQSDAFEAGFEVSRGEILITMDGDLQNPPEEIPLLLKALENHDAAFGWRHKRNDSFSKKVASIIANWFRNLVLGDGVPDAGCSLKAFKRPAIRRIRLFKGMHRFFPALIAMEGLSSTIVKVSHENRKWGKTKYGNTRRAITCIIDLLAVFWMRKRKLTYEIDEIV